MNCKDLKELLSAYVDGELSRTQREFLEEHLAGCAHCRAIMEDYRAVGQKLTSLRELPAMPDRKGAIMSKIKEKHARKPSQKWLRPVFAAIPVVAILIALLVLQPWSSLPGPQSVMAKAYAATESLQSYRTSGSIIYTYKGRTSVQSSEYEFMIPDRLHIELTSEFGTFEFIIIGDKKYIRESDDASAKMYLLSAGYFSFGKEDTLRILDSLTDIQELPDETILGVDCLRLRGEVDYQQTSIAEGKKTEVELWIGKDDYLIRQIKRNGQVLAGDGGVDTFSSVVKYYDFNEPITIEPPTTASGELLPGWQLQSSPQNQQERTFSSDVSYTIGGDDLTHQQISFRITITNRGEEVASNVRVKVLAKATNDASGAVMIEAEPSTLGPIDLGPGESETYNVSWEYDASHTSKEELSRLVDYSRVFTRYTTPEGIEDVQVFSTGAVYPLKSPPTQKLAAQYEQARQQVDFPINVPTSLPKNLELSHVQVQGMPEGRQMLILLYGDPRAEHIKLSQRRFDLEMAENGGERQKPFEEAGFSRFTITNISGYWKQGVLCQTDIDDPSTQYWDMSKIQMFWDEGDMTYQLTARDVPVEELVLFAASMVKID